jgi:hypothetical protein
LWLPDSLPRLLLTSSCHPSCFPAAGQEGKAKHAKAKHETSYKEMAIYALQQVGAVGVV